MKPHETLLEGLELLLPDHDGRRLLRALLQSDHQQDKALSELTGSRDLGLLSVKAREAARGLRPLLHYVVTARGSSCDPEALATLRAARVHEAARIRMVNQVAGNILDTLHRAGARYWLLKGAALANWAYPEPGLRHCHDVDLLAHPDDLARAAHALRMAGFREQRDPSRPTSSVRLVHPSGLPVELHTSLLAELYYHLSFPRLESASSVRRILGRPVPTLSPAIQLLQVLGLAASTPQRHSLRWAVDAHFLVLAEPIEWTEFVSLCSEARLTLPASVLLGYLADDLGVPVPVWVGKQLSDAAGSTPPLARDIALAGARAGHEDTLILVRSIRSGLRSRLRTALWLLFPSRAYLRHTEQSGYGRRVMRWARALVFRIRGGRVVSPAPGRVRA